MFGAMRKTPQLKIRLHGDPCLRKQSTPLQEITISERMLFEAMVQTMYATDGIGLAAPQVGINKQIFVADMGPGPLVVVNPKILKRQGTCLMEEGCLSFPDIQVEIDRPQTIEVEYTDQNGQIVHRTFSDLPARIFLHENDHLLGKAIIDYASPEELEALKDQLAKIEQQSKQ